MSTSADAMAMAPRRRGDALGIPAPSPTSMSVVTVSSAQRCNRPCDDDGSSVPSAFEVPLPSTCYHISEIKLASVTLPSTASYYTVNGFREISYSEGFAVGSAQIGTAYENALEVQCDAQWYTAAVPAYALEVDVYAETVSTTTTIYCTSTSGAPLAVPSPKDVSLVGFTSKPILLKDVTATSATSCYFTVPAYDSSNPYTTNLNTLPDGATSSGSAVPAWLHAAPYDAAELAEAVQYSLRTDAGLGPATATVLDFERVCVNNNAVLRGARTANSLLKALNGGSIFKAALPRGIFAATDLSSVLTTALQQNVHGALASVAPGSGSAAACFGLYDDTTSSAVRVELHAAYFLDVRMYCRHVNAQIRTAGETNYVAQVATLTVTYANDRFTFSSMHPFTLSFSTTTAPTWISSAADASLAAVGALQLGFPDGMSFSATQSNGRYHLTSVRPALFLTSPNGFAFNYGRPPLALTTLANASGSRDVSFKTRKPYRMAGVGFVFGKDCSNNDDYTLLEITGPTVAIAAEDTEDLSGTSTNTTAYAGFAQTGMFVSLADAGASAVANSFSGAGYVQSVASDGTITVLVTLKFGTALNTNSASTLNVTALDAPAVALKIPSEVAHRFGIPRSLFASRSGTALYTRNSQALRVNIAVGQKMGHVFATNQRSSDGSFVLASVNLSSANTFAQVSETKIALAFTTLNSLAFRLFFDNGDPFPLTDDVSFTLIIMSASG